MTNWLTFAAALAGGTVGAVIAVRTYGYPPTPPPAVEPDQPKES